MDVSHIPHDEAGSLAQRLADLFAADPDVEAIVWIGSRTSGAAIDDRSDIDLCVYSQEGDTPLERRSEIIARLGGAARASLGLTFWGSGDVWFDAHSGIEVDVVYSSTHWLEEALDRVLRRHDGSCSTGAWHSVRTARILFDRGGWFARIQAWSNQPYPPELRRAIIARYLPVLREMIPSYRYNVEKSLPRRDLVFINNEVSWMLASYFEVLFALNCVPHPGAKRMFEQVARLCPRRPEDLEARVTEILRLSAVGDAGVLAAIDWLVDCLEALVREETLS